MKKNNAQNNTDNASVSGGFTGQYQLNTETDRTKKAFRNILIGIAALALSAIVAIGCYGSDGNGFIGPTLSILLALVALSFFMAEIIIRARFEKTERLKMERADKGFFDDAEVIPAFSTERMLRSDAIKTMPQNAARAAFGELPDSVPQEADLDFLGAVKDFVTFAAAHGCSLNLEDARKLFASLASSRIVVLPQMPTESFKLLVNTMGAYFGTEVGIDHVDAECADTHGLLFETIDGACQKKAAMQTLEAAQTEPNKLHFVALTDVRASNVTDYLSPFIPYANTPKAGHFVAVVKDGVTETYSLPSNLWIILHLAQDEYIVSLPEMLLECCSVESFAVSVCEKTESSVQIRAVRYEQFEGTVDGAACEVAETEWKKLDALTDYLNQRISWTISNRQWIGMETYIAVCNECGEPISSALDEAIAARIVPSILAKTLQADGRIDVTAGLNASFGDGQLPFSRKAIKDLSKSRAHV